MLNPGKANGDTLPADKTFTMQLAVQGMVMGKYPADHLFRNTTYHVGSFTNAQADYYSAPQQVDGSG
jgi:hypothetical protein